MEPVISLQVQQQDYGRRSPPIMMATAPSVDLSCFFCIMKRSKIMVQKSVKRRKAINMGTLSPPVPAQPLFQMSSSKLHSLPGHWTLWEAALLPH